MYGTPKFTFVLLLACFASARPLLNPKNPAPDPAPESHTFSRRDNPLATLLCPLLQLGLPIGTLVAAAPAGTTVQEVVAAISQCNSSSGQGNSGAGRDLAQDPANPATPSGTNSGTPGTYQRFASVPDPSGGSPDANGTGSPPNSGPPVSSQGQNNSGPTTPAPATNGPATNNGSSGSNNSTPSSGTNPQPAANDARVATANTSQNQSNVSAALNASAQNNQPPSSPAAGTPSPNANPQPPANGGSGFQTFGSSGGDTTNDAGNTNSNRPNSAQRNSSPSEAPLLDVVPLSLPIVGGFTSGPLSLASGASGAVPVVGSVFGSSSTCPSGGTASACGSARTG